MNKYKLTNFFTMGLGLAFGLFLIYFATAMFVPYARITTRILATMPEFSILTILAAAVIYIMRKI